MSRPAKPTELKVLEGTYRKDRAPEKPIELKKLTKTANFPASLKTSKSKSIDDGSDDYRKEKERLNRMLWKKFNEAFLQMQMLYDADLILIAAMVDQLSDYYYFMNRLAEDGTVVMMENKGGGCYPIPSPFMTMKNKAFDKFLMAAKEFGLTPAARSKISLTSSPEEIDPLMGMIVSKKKLG